MHLAVGTNGRCELYIRAGRLDCTYAIHNTHDAQFVQGLDVQMIGGFVLPRDLEKQNWSVRINRDIPRRLVRVGPCVMTGLVFYSGQINQTYVDELQSNTTQSKIGDYLVISNRVSAIFPNPIEYHSTEPFPSHGNHPERYLRLQGQ